MWFKYPFALFVVALVMGFVLNRRHNTDDGATPPPSPLPVHG
ncbi:MAG: hypothetical protein D6737_16560, partial [Chloroflexi bacterium]